MKKRILVVNNDIDTMSLLKGWLERKKYEVKFTGNGEEVPELVKKFSPDVIIIDILQHKAAEQLKAGEKTKNIPIIMLTGYTLQDQQKLLTAADDIIEKPFDPVFLEEKIEKCLKKAGINS
ncbi:MAG TPA: response regulator [Chitinophagaceae bacterium]|nr:response regulator [Chitinophagaceae bacterium]